MGPCNLTPVFFFFWLLPAAYGILVPQPGMEPGPSAVKTQSPNHWTAREVPHPCLYNLRSTPVALDLSPSLSPSRQ